MTLVNHEGSPRGDLGRLRRVIDRVDHAMFRVVEAVGAVALATVVFCTFIEVVFRYVFNLSLGWTEELARLSLMWLTFAAAAVVFHNRAHIRIDLLFDLLSGVPRTLLLWLIEIGIVVVLLVLATTGWQMTLAVWSMRMPVTDLPFGVVYLPLALFCTFMIFDWLAVCVRGETTILRTNTDLEGAI